MTSELSVEDLLEEQCAVLDSLHLQTAFIKSKCNLEDDILFIRESVVGISNGFSTLRKNLNQLQESNNSCQKLLLLYQELHHKILHMAENVPPELIEAYLTSTKKKSVQSNFQAQFTIENQHNTNDLDDTLNVQEANIKNCKKALFNEPKYPQIALLTKEEFDEIPKYMIGRQPLHMVNNLINSINQVLKAKYSLLSGGQAAAKKKRELDLYLHYKKQDIICESKDGTYFFTIEDYERHTKVKLDRVATKLMMVLRHCKRIREYRSKKELYYIVLN